MWNKVSIGFDVEEETVNFGTRKMAICDSAVYETNTVAIISKENESENPTYNNSPPEVRCSKFMDGNENGIAVIINESVMSFNSGGTELLNKCSFDFLIDCYSVITSNNRSFLLVALNNGDLHWLPLNSNGQSFFLKNVCNNKDQNKRTFVNITCYLQDEECIILLTSYCGNIYFVKNLNLSHLAKASSTQSKDDVQQVVENLKLDYVSLNRNEYDNFKVLVANKFEKFGEKFLLIAAQSAECEELLLWSINSEFICGFVLPKGINKLKKIRMSKNGSFIFALTSRGSFLVICPYTLSLIYHHEVSWRDFELMQDEENNLLVLTDGSPSMLQLINISGFKIKFQIDINEITYLAEQQSSLEDLLYLEVHCSEDEERKEKLFDSVYLKAICESQPEYRLERILRRGKFEEAEIFANTFNLDVEIVYKAHLQKLLQDIQPWTDKKVSVDESGNKVTSLLQKVKDTEFVAKCALNAISSDFTLIKNLFKYAADRIKSQISEKESNTNAALEDLLVQIQNSLLRLNTFMAVGEKPLTIDAWLSFCKVNLIEECLSLLKQGLLNQVILIWSCHIHQLKDQLTLDETLQFFRSIPSSISINQILDWFQIFLPVSFSLFPSILPSLILWCKEKINIMELLAAPDWIENAIWFSKKILRFIRLNVKPCSLSTENIIQAEYGDDSPLREILFYIKVLTEINSMKKDYGISITIAEYTQTNSEDVMFTVLDKVPLEELNSFTSGFFEQLILQKNLNGDVVISDYIQCLVEGSVNWWYWEEAPWESRVSILVNCIVSVEEKLKCILSILKHSPVPWSPAISKICDDALKYKNPLTKLLHEQKKMVNCKLILKKYDLKDNILTKTHINRVLLYIFSQNRNTMLEDALQIANTFDLDMCRDVNKLYVQHLVENKDFAKVLSFLDDDNLSLNMVINCCETIILKTHCLSGLPVFSEKYGYYMEVLDAVGSKLTRAVSKEKATGDISPSVISIDICHQLKRIHFLKTNYREDVTIQSLVDQTQRDELMKFCLDKHLQNMVANKLSMKKERMKLNKLADCFECSSEEVLIKFIRYAISKSEINAALYVCRLLSEGDGFDTELAQQLTDLGCVMLQYIIKHSSRISDNIIAPVIHSLVKLGLNFCSSGALSKGIEVSNWCKLIQNPIPVDYTTAMSEYKTLPAFSTTGSSVAILNLLASYGEYLRTTCLQSNIEYSYADGSDDMNVSNVSGNLPEVLTFVVSQEQENVCFPLMATLHWSILHNCFISNRPHNECPLLKQTKCTSKDCVSKLLKKLIGSRHLDTQFGLALLYYFPKEEASDWIIESSKRYKYDFQRLYAITELGIMYFRQNNLSEHLNDILKLRKQCIWGKQIMEYGLSYKEAFRESPYDRKQLLYKLMSTPSMNVNVLAKYCHDVNFDFQSCLKVYLKQTLLAWEPEFEVKTNMTTGENEIIVKPTHKKLLNKCREIIALIENVKELIDVLSNNLWESINYYYYEIFLISITLMEENEMKADPQSFTTYRTVFLFLSSYQRISKPQDFERDTWYQTFPNEQNLPPISEYRLPFRLIFPSWCKSNNDPWKLIRHELNIQTYKKWFSLLDALELDKNVLCTLAINQMTCDETNPERSKTEWCIHLRNQKLLADVESCIGNINNLEMASASLYYVVNHLPPGADQLAAAKLCFVHTKQWRDTEKSDKSEIGFAKVQKKYLTISTTHILYSHNLGKAQYLQLVLQPFELIHAIYNDPIILQRNSGDVVVFPDINKAAEEIGTLHKIDISQVRMELLDEWLQPENFIANVSGNEYLMGLHDSDCFTDKLNNIEYENFQRACYVIARDISTFGRHLVKIVFDQNSDDSKPISIRLRALQCLYAVTSEQMLMVITGQTAENLTNFMNTLKFLNELEVLGMTYSVAAFESAYKSEIVKSLLSFKNPKAVNLAARISRHFNVVNYSLWNEILSKMCTYEMVKELAELLPHFNENYHMLDATIFEKAWNTLLSLPLIKANTSISEEQGEIIEKSVKLIYFCPIVDRINLQVIRDNCCRISREDLIENIHYLKL